MYILDCCGLRCWPGGSTVFHSAFGAAVLHVWQHESVAGSREWQSRHSLSRWRRASWRAAVLSDPAVVRTHWLRGFGFRLARVQCFLCSILIALVHISAVHFGSFACVQYFSVVMCLCIFLQFISVSGASFFASSDCAHPGRVWGEWKSRTPMQRFVRIWTPTQVGSGGSGNPGPPCNALSEFGHPQMYVAVF